MASQIGLHSIPPEIIEEIALTTAVCDGLRPPVTLAALSAVDRRTAASLSLSSNTSLSALLFYHYFDSSALKRRLEERVTNAFLADELRRRFLCMRRIRSRHDAQIQSANREPTLRLLAFAYTLLTENEGKNMSFLLEYAHLDQWIDAYWFSDQGASRVMDDLKQDRWPEEGINNTFAMWVLWLLMGSEAARFTDEVHTVDVMKLYALGAHRYPSTLLRWGLFDATQDYTRATATYYEGIKLAPPPASTPGILAFLTIVNRLVNRPGYTLSDNGIGPSLPTYDGGEWDADWSRSIDRPISTHASICDVYQPRSIEGVWQGLFTYTEFTSYARLLAGAPPNTLQRSIVVRHRQTWKLREYHLQLPPDGPASFGARVPLGSPLRSHVPRDVRMEEDEDGLTVTDANERVYRYARPKAGDEGSTRTEDGASRGPICDIIIVGEGHSSWGQFSLFGRIRPWDGFISISKEYVDGDRGTWLYRGYLVGGARGNLVGRWRDTLSPDNITGYEGCFTMGRRQ
ncbi:hypothetical protein GGF50DRAFT_54462 [Schizophyllum commune]